MTTTTSSQSTALPAPSIDEARWTLTDVESSSALMRRNRIWSYHAYLTGTGAVSATILIEARNVGSGTWRTLGTLSPSGTDAADDSITTDTPWLEHRARCTAISGTSAAVIVTGAGAA